MMVEIIAIVEIYLRIKIIQPKFFTELIDIANHIVKL